ncbi:helix-turn-helix transcriptional regulator [Paracoccus sp. (in: a-proteobacteria)]|uniref:helix-turn-helix domain-containing protein n=1 Tax=Paracoccus sp. TaxID=267 RepID=UPI002AFE634F|nr:helix-turn-helix transcriptional regulator [Paracoccus sp. (in: a-proteobacteria)]
MTQNPIFQRIQALLDRDGITLRDLERGAGIPYSRSYEWNRRENSKPNGQDALTLARFFNVPVGHIMDGDPLVEEDSKENLLHDYGELLPEGRRQAEQYVRFLLQEQRAARKDGPSSGSQG